MILTIDCGNTNIVMGVFDDTTPHSEAEPVAQWRIPTKPRLSKSALLEAVSQHIKTHNLAEHLLFKGVVIANVVPEYREVLHDTAAALSQSEPVLLSTEQAKLPLEIDVIAPDEVGEDRLVNVAGLGRLHHQAVIIIDFGTATTLDLVLPKTSDDGYPRYAGGIIAPGVHRSVDALVAAAAQLTPVPVEAFAPDMQVLGKNTEQAMRSGIYWGYVSLISGLIDRLEVEQQQPAIVIATGGLASIFAPHIPKIAEIDRNLTLRGLYHIYQFNQ